MPIATIKTIKGALTDAQKLELHQKITDVMVQVEGRGNEALRKFVIVSIEELDPINMGIGGKAASADFVKRITGR